VVEDPFVAVVEVCGESGELIVDADLITVPVWRVRHVGL
jgi:hypothetical protein